MKFEELYKTYFEVIYKYSFRILGQTDMAEDMTQETFVKLYDHFNSGQNLNNPKAWLYIVASNLCYNQLRRKKTYHQIIENNFIPNKNESNLEEEFIKQEEQTEIRKALKKLPIRDQMLLQLYQDELSYAEIAEVLKIKKTSVGKLLSRAIKKCAQNVNR